MQHDQMLFHGQNLTGKFIAFQIAQDKQEDADKTIAEAKKKGQPTTPPEYQ